MKNVLTNLLVESSLKFAGYGGQIQIYFKSMWNHYKNVCCCMLSKNVTDFIVEHIESVEFFELKILSNSFFAVTDKL